MTLVQTEPKKLYIRVELTPWIYHDTVNGLISLSSDGTNWLTIADKNLWATTVYNDGDTLSEANCGKYYQRWNNYGFPRTWSVTTSSTRVNASTYWPWNYYTWSTFIKWSADWSSVQNDNLWWWDTGTLVAMQWPCPTGFHVPSKDENVALVASMTALWIDTSNLNCMKIYMKMPSAGYRIFSSSSVTGQGEQACYWSSIAYSTNGAYLLRIASSELNPQHHSSRSGGFSIRPFKNTPVQPDDSRTVLYPTN